MKVIMIPIIDEALETVPKILEEGLSELERNNRDHPNHSPVRNQQEYWEESWRILRKVLQVLTSTSVENHQLELVWKICTDLNNENKNLFQARINFLTI